MFLATNREVREGEGGPEMLGERCNEHGFLELRYAEVTGKPGQWKVSVLPDYIGEAQQAEAGWEGSEAPLASRYVAAQLWKRMQKRDVLFFVHGYNNNVESVLNACHQLEKAYGVEVFAFSWPSFGGGTAGRRWLGRLAYLPDKSVARLSTEALYELIAVMAGYIEGYRQEVHEAFGAAPIDAAPEGDLGGTRPVPPTPECKGRISALFHSMGCYVYKHMFKSSETASPGLLFDNVILAAADTNNDDHPAWVDRIRFRNRLYVTINENDLPLRASRAKAGSAQRARLGHLMRNLTAENAHYVNVTHAPHVGNTHAYFVNEPVKKNSRLKKFFELAFKGQIADETLQYVPGTGAHEVKAPPRRK